VVGSANSSNSNRLAEVAREMGTPAYLVEDESRVDPAWLREAEVVGVTSGASAPEWLVDRMIRFLVDRGATNVDEVRLVEENVRFSMPAAVRNLPAVSA
jgi:4-hydroxy-3-methylbut-2-enyl diphosphate reductase